MTPLYWSSQYRDSVLAGDQPSAAANRYCTLVNDWYVCSAHTHTHCMSTTHTHSSYAHACMHACTHTRTHTHAHTHAHTHTRTHTRAHTHAHTHTVVYECIVCMFVVCACLCGTYPPITELCTVSLMSFCRTAYAKGIGHSDVKEDMVTMTEFQVVRETIW